MEREPAMAEGITRLQTRRPGQNRTRFEEDIYPAGESLMFIKSIGPQVVPACVFEHNKCVKMLHSL